jgi:hypothetical protein
MLRVFRFAFVSRLAFLVFLFGVTLSAQFGHPLKGTWSGEWGPNKTHVVLEFNWDGKNITGSINPGAAAVPFSKATLDGATWMVHAEAEKNGVKYVIDGKMENIGAYARFITGTWQQGNQKGNFKITRN